MYDSIDELWTDTIVKILGTGDGIESRVGATMEIGPYVAALSNVDKTFLLNKRRKLSPSYACAEVLWYLSETDKIDMIVAYAPQYKNYAEDGVAKGAYGARWKEYDQLGNLIKVLRQSPNSRQAVMIMWNGSDLGHAVTKKHKDLPCTLSLQFLVRDDKLHLITTMRSNDAWLGLPYDLFAFTSLQWLVATVLGYVPGTYTHQVGSMHLYEKNRKAAEEALLEQNCYLENRELNILKHNWQQAMPTDWRRDVRDAVTCEERFRIRTEPYPVPVNDTLWDLVACCAKKWGHDVSIKSPILWKGIKNAKRQV